MNAQYTALPRQLKSETFVLKFLPPSNSPWCEKRMLLPNDSVSSAVFISQEGHGRVTSTYLAPCTQGPLMITALLMALMMVISIYWLILKWVAKVGNDVSEILWITLI